MSVLGAIGLGLGTAMGIAAPFVQEGTNKRSQKRAYEYNRKLMGYQDELNDQNALDAYNRQLEAWSLNNEYNAPDAARARLEEAGLNPALLYGGGAAGVGTAGALSPTPSADIGISPVGTPTGSSSVLDPLLFQQLEVMKSQANLNNAAAAEKRGETKPQQVEMNLKTQEARLLEEKIIGQRTANDISALQYELDKEWLPSNYEQNNRILTRRAETAVEELIAARNENALYPDKVEQLNATIENILADTLNKRANAVLVRIEAANKKYEWQNIKPRVVEQIRAETKRIAAEARKNGLTSDILQQDLDHYDANFWNQQITSYVNAGANVVGSVGSVLPF